jgi:predicted Zn-dependent protease with MMP-like domain
MMPSRVHHAPSADDIEALARQALDAIPAMLRSYVGDVIFRVQDFADDETLDAMGIESPFDLLGLYHGVSIDRQSTAAVRQDVDMIFLYRRPILDYWCETGESLADVVRHLVIHEVGHHFGFSDEDMHRIEDGA